MCNRDRRQETCGLGIPPSLSVRFLLRWGVAMSLSQRRSVQWRSVSVMVGQSSRVKSKVSPPGWGQRSVFHGEVKGLKLAADLFGHILFFLTCVFTVLPVGPRWDVQHRLTGQHLSETDRDTQTEVNVRPRVKSSQCISEVLRYDVRFLPAYRPNCKGKFFLIL